MIGCSVCRTDPNEPLSEQTDTALQALLKQIQQQRNPDLAAQKQEAKIKHILAERAQSGVTIEDGGALAHRV